MMDFDYVCQRTEPSVSCMVYPMVGGDSKQNFYWGHKEILIPGHSSATDMTILSVCDQTNILTLAVYKSMSDAMRKHPEANTMVSFASLRSAYDSTLEAMEYPQIKTIAIIAEGIPENMTRKLIKAAKNKNITIIGENLS